MCAICAEPESKGKSLSIDHDHSCCSGSFSCGKCIRGLVCSNCNHGLGFLNDSIDRMHSAIRYLELWDRRKSPFAQAA